MTNDKNKVTEFHPIGYKKPETEFIPTDINRGAKSVSPYKIYNPRLSTTGDPSYSYSSDDIYDSKGNLVYYRLRY